jgi:hypothetical protein
MVRFSREDLEGQTSDVKPVWMSGSEESQRDQVLKTENKMLMMTYI